MDSDQTLSSSSPPDNRWEASPEDFARLRDGPVFSHLDDLAVLQIEGDDAVSFLQAQATADLAAMTPESWQLGGYCTPKGRLLAIFEAWRWQSGLRILLPAEIADATLRRLSMFVLRSKARLTNASGAWSALGVFGGGSAALLTELGLDVPSRAGQCTTIENDGRLAMRPHGDGCAERFVMLVPAQDKEQWTRRLTSGAHAVAEAAAGARVAAPHAATRVAPALWWWSQVDAAVPAVFSSTREWFVPQAVNLELLDGVSFRKGCYPGQEIVARSQYLGKLRRRLMLGHAAQIASGTDVFHSEAPNPVGRIVMAAAAPRGGWDLLFECPTDRTEQGSLHAGSADGPQLEVRTLPYPIFDPTT
jgi:folate-binding protein YgfZ